MAGIFGIGASGTGLEEDGRDEGAADVLLSWKAHQVSVTERETQRQRQRQTETQPQTEAETDSDRQMAGWWGMCGGSESVCTH